ncbi:MAG: ZIP family metal transporter [Oscillospiraceae bacterium]|nr:ZIP family metal transporter [Oscillospiraceae bacterium]
MQIVLLTALGVGGATVLGAAIGFLFKASSRRVSDIILSVAAGVMLSAAMTGLILPSLEYGGRFALLTTIAGVFTGAVLLDLMNRAVPHICKASGVDITSCPEKHARISKVLLFVLAIAIHNLPEGIAAGVGFGTGNTAEAMTVAMGIAMQNIPEGMVIIAPMLASGISRGRTFLVALGTGLIEVVGTFVGYFAVSLSQAILPFALAFAGGTMIYVISDEMIPETHSEGEAQGITYALLAGFCLMLAMSYLMA